MSENDAPTEPVDPTGESEELEILGGSPERTRSRGRRILVGVGAVAVIALGGVAYAAYAFLSGGGPQPSTALPASTVAYASIDLDPSAGQKIEAIRTVRKFPALRDELDLDTDDDLREAIFDEILAGSGCDDVDYEDDVAPWLGKRAAYAAVDLGEPDPAPAFVLQIDDEDAARSGIDRIIECGGATDVFFYRVSGDYLVASDTDEHAKAIVAGADEAPLADDADFIRWLDAAGDPGVASFYVGRGAATYFLGLSREIEDSLGEAGAPLGFADLEQALDAFEGMGGTLRFSDGSLELSVAAGGVSDFVGAKVVGDMIAALPADTTTAYGLGIDEDFAENVLYAIEAAPAARGVVDDVESATGLKLPADLQTLLGEAITLSLGSDAPASLVDLDASAPLPVGLMVHGDAARIRDLIARVEQQAGMSLADLGLAVESNDDRVALAMSADYARELLDDGALGESDQFRSVIPEAEKALGLVYVDFDSPWRERLIELAPADEAKEIDANTEPLGALGISGWRDGDDFRYLIRLTTD